MTKSAFDAAVDQLLVQFRGSVTSGRRTRAHTLAVGGFVGDPHTWGFGVDVVWDAQPPSGALAQTAQDLEITVIHESTHDHLQPADFPSGPVHTYGGVTKA